MLTQGMKVAVIEGHDIGGTCVNRGCVPSKALLAAAGRVREMKNEQHMKSMGIQVRWRLSNMCGRAGGSGVGPTGQTVDIP